MSITSPGTYRLRANRIGYTTIESPAFEIGDWEVVEVEVRLAVEAVVMEPLTVVVRRPATQRERDLRGFYERTERYGLSDIGPRQIYTREKLAGWDAFSVEEVFRFYMRWTPYGSGCNPKVDLDGRQYGHVGDLGSMPVSILEGIELYAGSGPPKAGSGARAVVGSPSSGGGRCPRAEAASGPLKSWRWRVRRRCCCCRPVAYYSDTSTRTRSRLAFPRNRTPRWN